MPPAVTWRDGVHLTGTSIWCDSRRRRDICFVSSAERIARTGHGQLIATPTTLRLVDADGSGHLGVPVLRPFTLGTLRLELIPSGRGLGASALHVAPLGEDGGERGVLYAGAIRSAHGEGIEPAEVRSAATVVVDAPYGEPHHVFPPLADEITRAIAWVRAQHALGHDAALLVDGALDALEVLVRLAAEDLPVAASRAIAELAKRLPDGRIAVEALAVKTTAARKRTAPRAVVWPFADRNGLQRALAGAPFAAALASGRALDGTAGTHAAFVWAGAADRAALLAWIEATGAGQIFVTGACGPSICAALGPRARVIGPPRQMSLFPTEMS